MTRIGVIDLEIFFPAKDRFELAMTINALLASPGFEVWMQGEPLDVAAFLRTSSGKPRVSIFSLAHLDDAQRMFFVSLLLNAVARLDAGADRAHRACARWFTWTKSSGSFRRSPTRRRKVPLLTLLKQGARGRSGRGAGHAESGRSGLQGAVEHRHLVAGPAADRTGQGAGAGRTGRARATAAGFDRSEIDRLLSSLTSRVFLMRNVHEDEPDAVSVALGAVVPARPARPRRHQAAHGGAQERGPCRAQSGVSDGARVCAGLDAGSAVALLRRLLHRPQVALWCPLRSRSSSPRKRSGDQRP